MERLGEGRLSAQVLAVFGRACNILVDDGDLMALVTPEIGNGPCNIVVDDDGRCFARIEPSSPAIAEGCWLQMDGLAIDLGPSCVWDPRPDWMALRLHHTEIVSRLPMLRAVSLEQAPPDSLLALLSEADRRSYLSRVTPSEGWSRSGLLNNMLPAVWKAAEALQSGWEDNPGQLRAGAAELSGLGRGLTPAGDDFLIGMMIWVWLAYPRPNHICSVVAEVAAPRTTTISATFLRAASRGECDASWHSLLSALYSGNESAVTAAARQIIAHGATSGADSLAGFLYASGTHS